MEEKVHRVEVSMRTGRLDTLYLDVLSMHTKNITSLVSSKSNSTYKKKKIKNEIIHKTLESRTSTSKDNNKTLVIIPITSKYMIKNKDPKKEPL